MSPESLRLQEFFLEAALAVLDERDFSYPHLYPAWMRTWEGDGYEYTDTFLKNGDYVSGRIAIYRTSTELDPQSGYPTKTPLWVMQYMGYCEDNNDMVRAYLKRVLAAAYRSKTFYGGRGRCHDESELAESSVYYTNKWLGTFDYFHGEEEIYIVRTDDDDARTNDQQVYWLRFQGMTLLAEAQQVR